MMLLLLDLSFYDRNALLTRLQAKRLLSSSIISSSWFWLGKSNYWMNRMHLRRWILLLVVVLLSLSSYTKEALLSPCSTTMNSSETYYTLFAVFQWYILLNFCLWLQSAAHVAGIKILRPLFYRIIPS